MVRALPLTSLRMVISRTPTARAMRAEPWPITCRALSRSRVPPASTRARGTVWLFTDRMAAAVPEVVRRWPETRSWTVVGATPAAAAMPR